MSRNDLAWERTLGLQAQSFTTITGRLFDYLVDGNWLFIFHNNRLINRRITKGHLLRAVDRCPLSATIEIADCLGPSYIFGILMDPRVRQGLW